MVILRYILFLLLIAVALAVALKYIFLLLDYLTTKENKFFHKLVGKTVKEPRAKVKKKARKKK